MTKKTNRRYYGNACFIEIAPPGIPYRSLVNVNHIHNLSFSAKEKEEEETLFVVTLDVSGQAQEFAYKYIDVAIEFYNEVIDLIVDSNVPCSFGDRLAVPERPPEPETEIMTPDEMGELVNEAFDSAEADAAETDRYYYHEDVRAYLMGQEDGQLRVVAARAKVPEGVLRDIVLGEVISDEIADLVREVMDQKGDK